MIIVTAADKSHEKSLIRLTCMVREHHPESIMHCWDLGVSPGAAMAIQAIGPPVEYCRFDYGAFPSWMNVAHEAGQYAWKAQCVNMSWPHGIVPPHGIVVWSDAGCSIKAPLTDEMACARKYGIYASKTVGQLREWTHPETLNRLNVSDEGRRCGMRAATLIVFDTTQETGKRLLGLWAKFSMDRDTIAPVGSRKHPLEKGDRTPGQNHRQDQSVLTALIANAGLSRVLPVERWNWTRGPDIG